MVGHPPGIELRMLQARYREDGAVLIKSALTERQLALVGDLFDYKLAHPSPRAFEIRSEGGGVFITDAADPELPRTKAFAALLDGAPMVDLAGQFLSSPDVWFYYEQLFFKHGGKTRRTPWHQDTSYVPVEGPDIVRFWICLDPVDKEHSLEFVRGSHLGPLYNGSSFNPQDDTAPLYPDSDMPRLPDIESARDQWDIMSWAVCPGDVIAFHPSMLHGGAGTPPDRLRRSLSLIFFGERAYFAPRPAGSVEVLEQGAELPPNPYGDLEPGDRFRSASLMKVR